MVISLYQETSEDSCDHASSVEWCRLPAADPLTGMCSDCRYSIPVRFRGPYETAHPMLLLCPPRHGGDRTRSIHHQRYAQRVRCGRPVLPDHRQWEWLCFRRCGEVARNSAEYYVRELNPAQSGHYARTA